MPPLPKSVFCWLGIFTWSWHFIFHHWSCLSRHRHWCYSWNILICSESRRDVRRLHWSFSYLTLPIRSQHLLLYS
uniref:Uncharacterized protein n=1 Tax=Phlebotomus papatasi TaxID=29031 RepID=A0A1B0DAF2_PHLPP